MYNKKLNVRIQQDSDTEIEKNKTLNNKWFATSSYIQNINYLHVFSAVCFFQLSKILRLCVAFNLNLHTYFNTRTVDVNVQNDRIIFLKTWNWREKKKQQRITTTISTHFVGWYKQISKFRLSTTYDYHCGFNGFFSAAIVCV